MSESLKVSFVLRGRPREWFEEEALSQAARERLAELLVNEEVQGRVDFRVGDSLVEVEDQLLPALSNLCLAGARSLARSATMEYLGWDHPAGVFLEVEGDQVTVRGPGFAPLISSRAEMVREMVRCVARFVELLHPAVVGRDVESYVKVLGEELSYTIRELASAGFEVEG